MKIATKSDMKRARSFLLEGDAMKASTGDTLAQTINLPMGTEPRGEGWRIMTGNVNMNMWSRVAFRFEIQDEMR